MENYGGLSHAEMEVTIRLDRVDGLAHICSTWPEWSRRLERLFGCPKKETTRGGQVTSAFWTVPIQCVMVRKGKRQVNLTPGQRQAVSDRLTKGRQARQTSRIAPDSSTIPLNR